VQLTEVSTMLTDYLLAAVTAALGFSLWRAARGRAAVSISAIGFAALAVSAAAGGTYHGFALELSAGALDALWTTSTWTVGIFSFCIVTAAAITYTRGPARLALVATAAATLIAYIAWMSMHDDFRFVIYDTAFAMLLLLGLSLYGYRTGSRGAAWLLAGIAVSAAAAAVQHARISLHPSFNHNDLYHVVQTGAMCLFYRGALG
jgi:hypothetical protein